MKKDAPTKKFAARRLLPFVAFVLALLAGTAVGIEMTVRPKLGPDVYDDAPTGSTAPAAPSLSRAPDGRFTVLSYLPDDVKGPARAVAEQTVIVRANRSYATGFLIRDGIVITAAHVAGGSETPETYVRCWDSEQQADVVRIDALRDVMILHAAHCNAAPLKLDETALADRAPLHVAGYSFNFEVNGALRYHRLTAALPDRVFLPEEGPTKEHMARMAAAGVARLQAFDAVLQRGNSGSPVFREDGTVVGMFVIIDYAARTSFMVPASTIARVLFDANMR
jgi:S1-C subfamily serine protease